MRCGGLIASFMCMLNVDKNGKRDRLGRGLSEQGRAHQP